jgi:hypothetical protein
MTVCTRCHRQLKQPTETGMGAVCARKTRIEPVPAHERDLFGYEIEKAAQAALYRLQVHIDSMAADAHMEVRKGFHRARVLLLGWMP